MTPERQAAITRIVQVALAECPSIAVAKRTLTDWPGHPADPQIKTDALAMLDKLEQEATGRHHPQ
jgi:hypothetical protein